MSLEIGGLEFQAKRCELYFGGEGSSFADLGADPVPPHQSARSPHQRSGSSLPCQDALRHAAM